MSEVYIRTGTTRQNFSIVYHELWDVYHPLIGDKPTMYYLYLLRYRNNETNSSNHGKAWRGRKGVIEKFQLGYATMPVIDGILEAAGLVDIEMRPSHNGADKIYYTVHDPLAIEEFERKEHEITEKLVRFTQENAKAKGLIGKKLRGVAFPEKTDTSPEKKHTSGEKMKKNY